MPIPWLIGAAAVGAAAWLLSDSKEEKAQRAREKRWEEQDRIREEAAQIRQEAKEKEERLQRQQIRDFATTQAKLLAEKYEIKQKSGVKKPNIDNVGSAIGGLLGGMTVLATQLPLTNLNRFAQLAIDDPVASRQEWLEAFCKGSKFKALDQQIKQLEAEQLEIKALMTILDEVKTA